MDAKRRNQANDLPVAHYAYSICIFFFLKAENNITVPDEPDKFPNGQTKMLSKH